jgi:hypothetical protein
MIIGLVLVYVPLKLTQPRPSRKTQFCQPVSPDVDVSRLFNSKCQTGDFVFKNSRRNLRSALVEQNAVSCLAFAN